MSFLKKLFLIFITGLFVMGLSSCPERKEGPAERTGKKIDKAVEDAGEKMEDAGEKAGEEMEKAGEKIEHSSEK